MSIENQEECLQFRFMYQGIYIFTIFLINLFILYAKTELIFKYLNILKLHFKLL